MMSGSKFYITLLGYLKPYDWKVPHLVYNCCAATGMERKVHRHIRSLDDIEREVGLASLEECLEIMCADYTSKGGADNAVLERIMSLMIYVYHDQILFVWCVGGGSNHCI